MDSDSSDDYHSYSKRRRVTTQDCPYIDSVNRFVLDFDLEKVCSVTLAKSHVYACLVCGKYFQGRGKETPVYIHSLEEDHHIFMNLADSSAWCVPDNYEIKDSSLDDIRGNLSPEFTKAMISALPESSLSLTGSEFFPGLVGLNQVKDNSYFNSVIHALCAVVPLRDYFLLLRHNGSKDRLIECFADAFKKMNNSGSFKGLLAPHELVHCISVASNQEFSASSSDPLPFLVWLLSSLDSRLPRSVVPQIFQGSTSDGSFTHLSLTLPPLPVFKKESEFIPSVQISELFKSHFQTSPLHKLPAYMIVHFKRFVKNNFFLEKNTTLVRFPLANLDMSPYCDSMQNSANYDLVATICHEGKPEQGSFRSFVLHPVSQAWFECEGLRVKKVIPESVGLVEGYIQIWKLVV